MINQKKIIVKKVDDETRIDKWLKRRFPLLTQSYIENKIRRGLIKINNNKIKANHKVICNDIVIINRFSEKILLKTKIIKNTKTIPKNIYNKFHSSIIYESFDFIIINKWAGILTQGESKIGISINDIIKYISNDYNLVHRLDKDTSGLLIIAKNYKTARIFSKLFKEHKIEKTYLAICQGVPKNLSSIVNLDISNKKNDRNLETVTKYKVIHKSRNLSLILYKPITGRMHQLRIVSNYLNCPIIGDLKYRNNKKYINEKLKLNAFSLKFIFKNHQYEFKSLLPEHILKFSKKINFVIPSEKKINNILNTF